MERRRYHASLRNSPRTWYDPSNYGTATVQHASPRTSRGRVSAVVSADWTWNHDPEPASLRTHDRQIQQWCPSRLASHAGRVWMVAGESDNPGEYCAGKSAGADRRRPGLSYGAVELRLVPEQLTRR